MTKNMVYKTSTVADGNMSLRFGVHSDVLENRGRWLTAQNLDPVTLCVMACDHGEIITQVSAADAPFTNPIPSEVLITNNPTITLGLLTADCIPAIFYDPTHHAVALAHLNRKTIAHDLAIKTIEAMTQSFGTDPADLSVHFEPHIQAASYVHPLPFIEPTPPQLEPYIQTNKSGTKATVDFAAAHYDQIISTGVSKEHITISPIDVGTDHTYFSHYGSRKDLNRAPGRHLTIVTLV